MTTPLATALRQLADAVPADPDDHGPIAVSSDAVRSALTAVAVIAQKPGTMSNAQTQSDTLLTPDEAADYLRLPVRQLQQMRYRGVGPAYSHVGRAVRYAMRDLESWVRSGRVEPQGAA